MNKDGIMTNADISGGMPAGGGQSAVPLSQSPQNAPQPTNPVPQFQPAPAQQPTPSFQQAPQFQPAPQAQPQAPHVPVVNMSNNPQSNAPMSVSPPAPTANDAMAGALGKIMDRLEAFEQKGAQQAEEQNIFNAINPTGNGTSADFEAFTTWARNGGMSPAQQGHLDSVLANGTPADKVAMVSAYATAMHASTQAQNPQANMLQGSMSMVPQSTPAQGYMSAQDFATAMASEKFKTDPSYAQAVQTQRMMSRKMEGM